MTNVSPLPWGGIVMTMLRTNEVYAHDEILKVIHEEHGTFSMIYEVSSIGMNDGTNKYTVCIKNILIEYKGQTYHCDHLWFNINTMRDETIRVFRVNQRRKGGANGVVRMVEDISTTTYKGKDGSTRYTVYKESSKKDEPIGFVPPTKKYKRERRKRIR